MRYGTLLLVIFVASCCVRGPGEEFVASNREAFTSASATLLDFEFDASLLADTDESSAIARLIQTQLLFSVGELNADAAVGHVGAAATTVASVTPVATSPVPKYLVAYHSRLPVAWGGGAAPSTYVMTLPLSVDEYGQAAFANKYASACTDPEAGDVDAEHMFLFFRPNRPGCAMDPGDVVSSVVSVTTSTDNSPGKYPEYHRIWADQALNVVAVFGREFDDNRDADGGVAAYEGFVERAESYLRAAQPDSQRRVRSSDSGIALPNARVSGVLVDGRSLTVEVALIGTNVEAESAAFDSWYDPRTADADVLIYSGHAGLGANVRALAAKGVFRSGKYTVAVVNGCDSFAYLDDTLSRRRAALNPDDPHGTKYLDTVSNVLGDYFSTSDDTSFRVVAAMISAAEDEPRTYRQILAGVDPSQLMVVSGDEDNEFVPGMIPAAPGEPPRPRSAPAPSSSGAVETPRPPGGGPTFVQPPPAKRAAACAAAGPVGSKASPFASFAFAAALATWLTRLRDRAPTKRSARATSGAL